MLRAGASLREQARHLEQNHDLARGPRNILVANVVGPHGIGIEPQPRTRGVEIHDDLAAGELVLSADLAPATLTDALYIPPQMPWIDPEKEAEARERLAGGLCLRARHRAPPYLYLN